MTKSKCKKCSVEVEKDIRFCSNCSTAAYVIQINAGRFMVPKCCREVSNGRQDQVSHMQDQSGTDTAT